MYGREQRVLLRHYLEQGLTRAELARTLGVSRGTVYHWIDTGQLERELDNAPVRYRARPPVERKIDRYRQIILARLNEYPRLSATRLHDEVRAAGYEGGYTQVKGYVRQVRPTAPADPVVRFETPPGLQLRSILPSSAYRGASALRCWRCWDTRGCYGCSSMFTKVTLLRWPVA